MNVHIHIPGIVLWLFVGYCIMRIADRTRTENSWWAFIPILNVLLICSIADKPMWYAIGLLVPVVNLIVLAYLWVSIAERCRKPVPLGLLIFIPVVNLGMIAYLAFSEN